MTTSPETTTERRAPLNRAAFLLLVVISLGGVAIMDYSVESGLWYWLAVAVVSAGVSVGLAWRGAAEAGETAGGHLRRQVLHWLALIVALLLVFYLQRDEHLSPTTSGLFALLMVALATTLAGVHFRPRLAWVGLIQAATFVAAVLTERFFWILLVLVLVVVVVEVVMRARAARSAT